MTQAFATAFKTFTSNTLTRNIRIWANTVSPPPIVSNTHVQVSAVAVSKLANLLYGHALYARLTSNTKADDSGIPAANPPTIIFVHPGFVDTFSTDDRLPLKPIIGPLIRALVTQPEEGACTATFAAAASEASNPNYQGAYLIRGPRIVPQGEMEKNPNMVGKRREALQSEVWRSTMEYLDGVGVSFAETNAL